MKNNETINSWSGGESMVAPMRSVTQGLGGVLAHRDRQQFSRRGNNRGATNVNQ
jgi:hypothetical protein